MVVGVPQPVEKAQAWLCPGAPCVRHLLDVDQVDYPSPCYLRQTIPRQITRSFLAIRKSIIQHFQTDQAGLPELDEKLVKLRPEPNGLLSDKSPDFGTRFDGEGVVSLMDRDSPKSLMCGCHGSECHGDPFNIP